MNSAARLIGGFRSHMLVLGFACAAFAAGTAEAATKTPSRSVPPAKLWSEYPLDPTATVPTGRELATTVSAPAPREPASEPSPKQAQPPERDSRSGRRSLSLQLGLLAAFGLIAVLAVLSSLSALLPARASGPKRERRDYEPDQISPPAATRIRRKVGPEPAALRPAAIPAEAAPAPAHAEPEPRPRLAARPATWLAEPYESCEIAIWRGYLKSQFYARPTFPEPADYALESSPYFRSRSDVPKQRGRALAAYEALIEKLLRHGWEPSGLGGEWYEQWFRRPLLAVPVPRPRETKNGTKTPA